MEARESVNARRTLLAAKAGTLVAVALLMWLVLRELHGSLFWRQGCARQRCMTR